jgi:hypothetical protein
MVCDVWQASAVTNLSQPFKKKKEIMIGFCFYSFLWRSGRKQIIANTFNDQNYILGNVEASLSFLEKWRVTEKVYEE